MQLRPYKTASGQIAVTQLYMAADFESQELNTTGNTVKYLAMQSWSSFLELGLTGKGAETEFDESHLSVG